MAETVQRLRTQVIIEGLVTGDDGKQQIVPIDHSVFFTDGTGLNKVGTWFYDATRNLNNTSEDIDLKGSSSFGDFQGVASSFTGVNLIYLRNLDTDTGDYVTLKQASSNWVPDIFLAAGDGIKIHPGGFLLWVNPGTDSAAVTAGTGDLLTLTTVDDTNVTVFIAGKNA